MDEGIALTYDYGDDVEPDAGMRQMVFRFGQPLHRGMAKVDPFGVGHRLLGCSVPQGASGLDLHEHDLVGFVAGHDVKLSESAMPVAVDHMPALRFKPCRRVLFAEISELTCAQRAVMQSLRQGVEKLFLPLLRGRNAS